ncbi:MAG: hypothetical protein DYH05_12260, partial [Acidobacteria bacterium ACB1]|nr:hypothetical protein [Acidobacteria bacterium ACB1]
MKNWKLILGLTTVGIGLRVLYYALFSNLVIARSDAVENIMLGRSFAAGDIYGSLSPYWPPLYPWLVGIVSTFIDSLTLPAVIVSIITGSLAVPLTYWLAEQSYSKDTSLIAAIIAIFYPDLINSVFAIGTENPYLVCVTAALIAGWKGLKQDAGWYCFLTGVFLALAYLTRPEAIGYLLFFIPLMSISRIWQGKLAARRAIAHTVIFVLGFTLLAGPYLLYLRTETGKWTISAKVERNFASGAFSSEALERSQAAADGDAGTNEQSPKALAMNFALNLRTAQDALTKLVPFFALILVGLGLFGTSWDRERLLREGYLLLFCILTIVGYAASFVLERYLYVLLPIFFLWIAKGITNLREW